jgi:hypothetical protein
MADTFVIRGIGSTLIFSDPIRPQRGPSAIIQFFSPVSGVVSALRPLTIVNQALIITPGTQMPAPNSTIYSTITVTDPTGALVSNLSSCSLVVTFPDSTTSTLSLGSGITNIGSGQYRAIYNTKGVGEIRENWSIVAADAVTVATLQDYIGVAN